MIEGRVVIVGAGQAGGETAIQLRRMGFAGEITLLGEEPSPPYQRPPLSKKFLSGEMSADELWIRPPETFTQEKIDLRTGVTVDRVDIAGKSVTVGGASLSYDALVFATGSTPRKLPVPGAELNGIHVLRTVADVDALRPDLTAGVRLVIVGAGYIGLEVAAVARKLGVHVTVLEAAPRVLARVTGPEMSEFYAGVHRAEGVEIVTDAKLQGFEGAGRVTGAKMADGHVIPCDTVLVGIGIIPNDPIAAAAGIACDNGILVDTDARTSVPGVYAVGDCAKRPLIHYGQTLMRLESVHNALEQAKLAAASITGAPRPAEDTPWFWSDQYDLKLQIAGVCTGADEVVLRGDPQSRKFAAFSLKQGRIIAVDAVNSAPEFMAGKKLIAQHAMVAPSRLADTSVSMKDILASA
jgi:3-phenylpropionate/trans-cinnamate dioxygenase ferredoxin reductase component